MKLPPLHNGRIHRRYKRFLADVTLQDGREVTAHCPNTGAMTGCWAPGAPVQLSHSDNPRRKLPWTLERVDMGAGWIGVHTGRTNHVIAEGIESGAIPQLTGYPRLRREFGLTLPGMRPARLDIVLGDQQPRVFIEVKNVTLLDGDTLRFPDAVSERARRHLDVLEALVRMKLRGVILFAVNRGDGKRFAPAGDIDPRYAQRLREVSENGVQLLAVRIRHSRDGLHASDAIPVALNT